jgi:hypothetical protein
MPSPRAIIFQNLCVCLFDQYIQNKLYHKTKGKLYFSPLNFHEILQTPLNFKNSHFGPLNFELLLVRTFMLILAVKNTKRPKYL